MKNKQIKRAIDTSLASLRISERDVQNIMLQVQEGKRVKKKLSAGLAIALVLILLAATAIGVGVMSGLNYWSAADEKVGTPLRMATLNDDVYLIALDGFYRWTQEETLLLTDRETLKEMGIETLDCWMFVHDHSVMLLSKQGGLWRYTEDEWELCKDFANSALQQSFRRVRKLVCQEGCIFIDGSQGNSLFEGLLRFNLDDGTVDELPVEKLLRFCSYRDGKLLAVIRLSEEEEKLVVIDAESGTLISELITMHAMAMSGLAYNADSDRIYAMVDGALSVWNGVKWQEIRKASLPGQEHSFCVTDDFYLAAGYDGIQSIALDGDTEIEQTELTIRGVNSSVHDLDHGFQQIHPNLVVARQREGYFSAADVQKAIESGEQTDLFYIAVDASWIELMESGLLRPIPSEKMKAAVADMSTFFRNILMKNDDLYAVPGSAMIEAWEMLRADVPATYAELFAKPYDGLTWTGQRWSQMDYAKRLIKQQIIENGGQFDTPAFRETLDILIEAGLHKRSQTVMNTSQGFVFGNLHAAHQYCAPLKVDENADPHYPVTLHCYVLNPNAQNQQAALAYLEYAYEKTGAETKVILSPEHASPALHPAAELWIENVKLQHAQDVKDGLLPDDPSALEERLQIIRDMPGNQLVTRKQLEQYRETVEPYLDLKLHPLLSYQNQSLIEKMAAELVQGVNGEKTVGEIVESLHLLAREEMDR